MIAYNLKGKVHNRCIFSKLTKGVYGLPETVSITHDALVQHLAPYGYHHTKNTPGLWTPDRRPINFTLVIKYFGVKYSGR